MIDYTLKKYQETAVEEVKHALSEIALKQKKNPSGKYGIQITAPTGAGKTVIIGHLLLNDLKKYVSIVLSPGSGDLEQQTLNRLNEIVTGRVVRLDSTTIKNPSSNPGDVYVSNWEALVSKDKGNAYSTRLSREGEQTNFWDLIRFFKKNHLKVAVIIDESHHGAKSAGGSISTFIEDITKTLGIPPLFIEVSATPVISADTYRNKGGDLLSVSIPVEDVIKEGMLRKDVVLNFGIKTYLNSLTEEELTSVTSERGILEAALKQQNIIDAEYKKIGSDYHSLVAIQLPNSAEGEAAKIRLTSVLAEHKITRDKDNIEGALGSYMDGQDGKWGDFANIASADSPLKVIFYKQGISMGWDCPRAQILVGYRHLKSNVFTKQNLGRFVRTTERKHYENPILDTTYVYTNTKSDLGSAGFAESLPGGASQITEIQNRCHINGRLALASFDTLNLHGAYTIRNFKQELDYREIVELWKKNVDPIKFLKSLIPASLNRETMFEGKISVKELTEQNQNEHVFAETEVSLLATEEARAALLEKINIETRIIGRPDFDVLSPHFTSSLLTFLEPLVVAGIYAHSSSASGKAYYGIAASIRPKISILQTAYAYRVLNQPENFALLREELKKIIPKVPIHKEETTQLADGETLESVSMYSAKDFLYKPHDQERINGFNLNAEKYEMSGRIPSNKYAYQRELGGSFRTEKASSPELAFEEFITKINDINPNIELVSFAKNSQRMLGGGFSVVIENNTGKETILNKFFPDYFVEFELIKDGISKIIPCIFEVKDTNMNSGFAGGQADSLRKAVGLIELQNNTPGLKAGVIRPASKESQDFTIITSVKTSENNKWSEEKLIDFILN